MIILAEKLIVVLMGGKKKDMAKTMTIYSEFKKGGLYQNRKLILIQLSFTSSTNRGLGTAGN